MRFMSTIWPQFLEVSNCFFNQHLHFNSNIGATPKFQGISAFTFCTSLVDAVKSRQNYNISIDLILKFF